MDLISSRGMPPVLAIAISRAIEEQKVSDQDLHKISNLHFEFNYDKPYKKLPNKFNTLILWEPQSVMPWQYKKSVLSKFDLVIPMSPWRAENLGFKQWAFHPSTITSIQIDESLRKKNIIMINAAKFSANKNSLYGLRRKLSKKLFDMNVGYELYGQNWHMKKSKELRERIWAVRKELMAFNFPDLLEAFTDITYKYPEYMGPIDEKLTKLSEFKYALVIENELDWITEKLFDALSAGCVPLYIGPNLSKFEQLNRCVIQLEPSVKAVSHFFTQENTDLYLSKKLSVDNLKSGSRDVNLFSLEKVAEKIASIVKNAYLKF